MKDLILNNITKKHCYKLFPPRAAKYYVNSETIVVISHKNIIYGRYLVVSHVAGIEILDKEIIINDDFSRDCNNILVLPFGVSHDLMFKYIKTKKINYNEFVYHMYIKNIISEHDILQLLIPEI